MTAARGRLASLSPASRRLLAVALVILPLAVIAGLIALPAQLAERQATELEALEAHVVQLEERLVTREQVLAELRQLERTAQVDARMLDGETPGVAGAVLAGTLGDYLQRAGGRLDSTQVLEPVLDQPLMRIGVRLRGAVDMEGLASFLHAIESSETILTIERLAVRNEDLGAVPGIVLIELTVVGYARMGTNAGLAGLEPTRG